MVNNNYAEYKILLLIPRVTFKIVVLTLDHWWYLQKQSKEGSRILNQYIENKFYKYLYKVIPITPKQDTIVMNASEVKCVCEGPPSYSFANYL